MPLPSLKDVGAFATLDRVKVFIVLGFSILVGVAFLTSLGSMIYFRVADSKADIGLWVNIFLTCLGYIVGILTGLLGIPGPGPPSGPSPSVSSTQSSGTATKP